MRIEVLGNKEIIRSVSMSQTAIGLSMMINTTERWPLFHYAGSSAAYLSSQPSKQVSEHACFIVSDAHDEGDQCEIVLVPETQDESSALRNLKYTNSEKDQIVVEFIRRESLKAIEEICSWKLPAPRMAACAQAADHEDDQSSQNIPGAG